MLGESCDYCQTVTGQLHLVGQTTIECVDRSVDGMATKNETIGLYACDTCFGYDRRRESFNFHFFDNIQRIV